jgi:hypothetical protein
MRFQVLAPVITLGSVESSLDIDGAPRRVNSHDNMVPYEFVPVSSKRIPQLIEQSGDDIEHDTLATRILAIPELVRFSAATWRIPEILGLFKTSSDRAYQSIVTHTGLLSPVEGCGSKGKATECIHAYTMHVLLLSELASRETRIGEAEFRLPSQGVCSELASNTVTVWMVEGLRSIARVR